MYGRLHPDASSPLVLPYLLAGSRERLTGESGVRVGALGPVVVRRLACRTRGAVGGRLEALPRGGHGRVDRLGDADDRRGDQQPGGELLGQVATALQDDDQDRKSTRLNSITWPSRM